LDGAHINIYNKNNLSKNSVNTHLAGGNVMAWCIAA